MAILGEHFCAVQFGMAEVAVLQIRSAQICVLEVRVQKLGAGQIRSTQLLETGGLVSDASQCDQLLSQRIGKMWRAAMAPQGGLQLSGSEVADAAKICVR